MLNVEIDQTEAVFRRCRLEGELDASTVSQFREVLANLASSSSMLIDLSDVSFLDSAGLGALIGGIRRTRELGGDVAVVCSRPSLTRLLRTTGLDRIVVVAGTTDKATAALQGDAIPT
jgi:anti-sigma B factor antagonist